MFRFGDPGGRIYTNVGTSNANLQALWSTINLGGSLDTTFAVSAGNGRATGSAIVMNLAATNRFGFLGKNLDNQAILGVAMAFKWPGFPGGAQQCIIFSDGATQQVDLSVNPAGTLRVTRNGTLLGTTTLTVPINVWVHIEIKVTFHSSAGTVGVWINGVSALSLTAQNTSASGNAFANIITIGTGFASPGISGNVYFDDIIFYDGQTTDANGFTDITGPIGDCGLIWLLPAGTGTTTQFTPDTGSNYARVNEATPDGDTSYVSDATVGHIDTYAMADLPVTVATVKSLASIHFARKDDVSSRGMKAELRSAGANAAHPMEIALGNNYQYYFSNWGQNPNNGSPINWTPTSVNALEAGQTVSS